MSVLPSDIIIYGSNLMPEADLVTIGGAIDFTKRADFFDVTPNGTLDIVSSSASDTGVKVTYVVRDAGGVAVTVANTLTTGTAPVIGSQTAERLLYSAITGGSIGSILTVGGTTAVGDVAVYAHTIVSSGTLQAASNPSGTTPTQLTLKSGDGANVSVGQLVRCNGTGPGTGTIHKIIAISGDVVSVNGSYGSGIGTPNNTSIYQTLQGMLFEQLPNAVKAITRLFGTAAADTPGGSTRTFYEKVFVINTNTATTLTAQSGSAGCAIQITGESPALSGGVLLDLASGTGFNDSVTFANRQSLSAGSLTAFTTQPQNIFVPLTGNLAFGGAGVATNSLALWLRLTVPAGASPYKGAATIQTLGNTT